MKTSILTLVWLITSAGTVQAAAPGTTSAPPAVTGGTAVHLGTLMAKGDMGLASLKKYSFVSGKVLVRDKAYTVYAGFRDPIFQLVLWGAKEKPDRVLVEFEPRKQTMDALKEFSSDWDSSLPPKDAKEVPLETLSKENAEHMKTYCAKLPTTAHCESRMWSVASGKIIRVDIHLKVGPPVPKAIEFERKPPTP